MNPSRAAKNEATFREVNERIAATTVEQQEEWTDVLCECHDPSCARTIPLTLSEYEAVRARGERFALVWGHEDAAVEHVIERNERFLVVEKFGTGRDVARDFDPRGE